MEGLNHSSCQPLVPIPILIPPYLPGGEWLWTNLRSPLRKAQSLITLDLIRKPRRQQRDLANVADNTARLVGVGLEPVANHLPRAHHELFLWPGVAEFERTPWVQVLDVLAISGALKRVNEDGQKKGSYKVGKGLRGGISDGLDVEPLHPRWDGAGCGRWVGHGLLCWCSLESVVLLQCLVET